MSIFGKKSNLIQIKVFGCITFIHLDKINYDKLSPRSILEIKLGLENDSKSYRL